MTTKENEIISDEHHYPQNEAENVASMAVEKIKKQVQKIKPVPAITRELPPREDHIAAYLPTLPSLKPLSADCNVNASHQYLPPREEVHFCGDAGENFLLVEDGQGDNKIMIFSTVYNLELLAQTEPIHADGAYQICPSLIPDFLSACTQEWQTVSVSLLSSARLFESS